MVDSISLFIMRAKCVFYVYVAGAASPLLPFALLHAAVCVGGALRMDLQVVLPLCVCAAAATAHTRTPLLLLDLIGSVSSVWFPATSSRVMSSRKHGL